jgi:hypothetical protein
MVGSSVGLSVEKSVYWTVVQLVEWSADSKDDWKVVLKAVCLVDKWAGKTVCNLVVKSVAWKVVLSV